MHTKRRVLFVVGFLWGDEGIVQVLVVLARGLITHGWEVAIASPMIDQETGRFTRGPKWFEKHGIRHFFVPFSKSRTLSGKVASAYQPILSLDRAVRSFKPDVIHVHSLSLCPYTFAIRLLYKVPYVSTPHILSPHRSSLKLGTWINKRFDSFLGNRFIAISTEIKEAYAQNLKVPESRIRLVYHGVDPDYFRPPTAQERLEARQAFGLSLDAKVVCLIGRLYPIKGHDVLVKAISILRGRGLDVIALCAGAGDREEIKNIETHANLGNVSDLIRLLGFTEVRQVLWASDALVLPSRIEGFPWAIVEGMMSGLVPIRTPTAGVRDQTEDGINGFVVAFDDAEALADRLQQLLNDNQLRTRMATLALELARQKFTVDQMIQNTLDVYNEAIYLSE